MSKHSKQLALSAIVGFALIAAMVVIGGIWLKADIKAEIQAEAAAQPTRQALGFASPAVGTFVITTDPSNSASSTATSTQMRGSLGPDSNNTFNLGYPNQSWRDIYASGTAYLVNLVARTLQITANPQTGYVLTSNGSGVATWQLPAPVSNSATGTSGWITNSVGQVRVATTTDYVGIGTTSSTARLHVATTFDEKLLILQAHSAQLRNIFEAQTSAGVPLVWISGGGAFGVSSTAFLSGIATTGSVLPVGNQTLDLGSPTSSWRNIYASSTAFLSGLLTSGSILPTLNNALDLGGATSSFRNIFASSTLTVPTLRFTSAQQPSWTFDNTSSSTINKPCGVSRIPTGSTTSTVNNSLVGANSFVMLSLQSNPGASSTVYATTSSAQLVLNTTSNAQANISVAWCVMQGQ